MHSIMFSRGGYAPLKIFASYTALHYIKMRLLYSVYSRRRPVNLCATINLLVTRWNIARCKLIFALFIFISRLYLYYI